MLWGAGFALALAAVVVSHLAGLASAPPGLYNDEASIGYNAWTIAHYGTDQFGTSWPLLFRDFGDFKSPASTYLLAPFTLLFPLTAALTRMPSAVAGVALAVAAGVLAWRLTRVRVVALLVMLEAAFEPWFFHTARIDLEADLFTVLCMVVALAALAGDGARRLRACAVAGVALALAPLAAQPGRYFAIVLAALVVVAYRRRTGQRQLALLIGPVLATTLWLIVGTAGNGTARLTDVSVFHGRSLVGGVGAWIANYPQYFSPSFLFVNGDPNIRHSTGFEGLILATAIPVLIAGLVSCARTWHEPLSKVALLGLVIAPVGPAVTVVISARRDIVFLPFLVIVLARGWLVLSRWLSRRLIVAVALAAATAAAGGAYLADYALAYPSRSAAAFNTGVLPALLAARQAAAGHHLLVSFQLPGASSQVADVDEIALFALLPAPSARPGGADAALNLTVMTNDAPLETAAPGDVAVLSATHSPPTGFTLIDVESLTGPTSLGGASATHYLVDVYRHT